MQPHAMNVFQGIPHPSRPMLIREDGQSGKETGVSAILFIGTSMAPSEPQIRNRLRGRWGPCVHKKWSERCHEGSLAVRYPHLSARILRGTRFLACLFEIEAHCPANLPITK